MVGRNDNVLVSINPNYETCNEIGTYGMFKVINIEDDFRNDYSSNIDSGQHYNSLDDALKELSSNMIIDVL